MKNDLFSIRKIQGSCLTKEQFARSVRLVLKISGDAEMALAECAASAISAIGLDDVKAVLAQEGVPNTLAKAALTLAKMPRLQRQSKASNKIKIIVAEANLAPAEAVKLLNWAVDKNLAAHEVKASISAGKLVRLSAGKTGKPKFIYKFIESISLGFSRWRNKETPSDSLSNWSHNRLKLAEAILQPVAEYVAEIEKHIKEKGRQ